MNTGFTWETQDRAADIAAAEKSWSVAEEMLRDDRYHLVVLDELTYMLSFKYLSEDRILEALNNRPENQSVVVTGRGGGKVLVEWADTVSEIKEIKHAYNEGIMARKGVDL
jgi:cob(I)alamin adenosyltransferase